MSSSVINRRRLWTAVIVLWVLWALRAHSIMTLPVFVDESLHMMRSQVVFEFTDAKASILPAKLLLYYYFGLFDLQDAGGAWLARQAIALLAPLGAALTFVLARQLFRRASVGLVAVLLYALTPFLVFFERMALADSFAMVFGLALAVVSLRLAHHPTRANTILTGLILGMALLAKLTTLPLAVLPPLALLLFGKWSWSRMFAVGLIAGLMLLPSVTYMAYQEINPPENKVESVEQDLFVPASNSRLQQIRDNVETYSEASRAMFSDALLILLLIVGGWQLYRTWPQVVFLLVITALTWGLVVVTAARPSTRYLVLGVPSLLILIAAGLVSIGERLRTPRYYDYALGALYVGLVGWWMVYSLGFLTTAWSTPRKLTLADRDIWEYYQNSAAGYGLREAAYVLPNLAPLDGSRIPVVGFVGGCHIVRWYLPADSDVDLFCPYFRWRAEQAPETLAEWRQRVQEDGVWYLLADRDQPMDLCELEVQWEEMGAFSRPHNGIPLKLFKVIPMEDADLCLIPW